MMNWQDYMQYLMPSALQLKPTSNKMQQRRKIPKEVGSALPQLLNGFCCAMDPFNDMSIEHAHSIYSFSLRLVSRKKLFANRITSDCVSFSFSGFCAFSMLWLGTRGPHPMKIENKYTILVKRRF